MGRVLLLFAKRCSSILVCIQAIHIHERRRQERKQNKLIAEAAMNHGVAVLWMLLAQGHTPFDHVNSDGETVFFGGLSLLYALGRSARIAMAGAYCREDIEITLNLPESLARFIRRDNTDGDDPRIEP